MKGVVARAVKPRNVCLICGAGGDQKGFAWSPLRLPPRGRRAPRPFYGWLCSEACLAAARAAPVQEALL